MKITYVILILLLISPICYTPCFGIPDTIPSARTPYVTGNTIDPDENNANENAIYNAYNAHSHTAIEGTTSTTWTIGGNTDTDHDFIVDNGDTNNPLIRYNSTNSRWEFSNNGTDFFVMAASSSVTGILDGFELFYDRDNPNDAIIASGGSVIIGGIFLETTDITESLAIATDDFWIGGSAADNASTWIYVYVFNSGDVASFNFSTTAPNAINSSGDTGGRPKWFNTGGTSYRCIGAIRNDSNKNIASFNMVGNLTIWDGPISLTTAVSDNAWATLSCSAGIPEISALGIFGLYGEEDTAGNIQGIWIRPHGTTWFTDPSTHFANGVTGIDTAGTTRGSGQRECMTDGSQQIDYFNHTGDSATEVSVEGYRTFVR